MLVDLGAVPVAGLTGHHVVVLAENVPPGKGPEFGKASPVGLIVILLLALATAFLIRSMIKHLKRVPASFDDPPSEPKTDDAADARDAEDTRGRNAT